MKMELLLVAGKANVIRRASHVLATAAFVLLACGPASAEVSQTPLYLGGGNVPGNLTLVPSVEWPTINSVANLGDYTTNRTYLGYFDPNKCYAYSYSSTEADRHFYPVSWTTNRLCAGRWSGNFMNWAATQTIDPFRWVLTGGYRVRDTASETWLEKARHSGRAVRISIPIAVSRTDGNSLLMVQGATPLTANWIQMRIEDLGNKMRFRLTDEDVDEECHALQPRHAGVVRPGLRGQHSRESLRGGPARSELPRIPRGLQARRPHSAICG